MIDLSVFNPVQGAHKYMKSTVDALNRSTGLNWIKATNLTPHLYNSTYVANPKSNISFFGGLTEHMIPNALSVYGIGSGNPEITQDKLYTLTNPIIFYALMKFKDFKSNFANYYDVYSPYISIFGRADRPLNDRTGGAVMLPVIDIMGNPAINYATNNIYDDYFVIVTQKIFDGETTPRTELSTGSLNIPSQIVVPYDFSNVKYKDGVNDNNRLYIVGRADYYTTERSFNSIRTSSFNSYIAVNGVNFPMDGFATVTNYMSTSDRPLLQGYYYSTEKPYVPLVAGQLASLWDTGNYYYNCQIVNSPYNDIAIFNRPISTGYRVCLFESENDVLKWYNDFGFKATNNLDEAINSEIVDPDYTPPGVPDVPPDIESFPDNSSDPITFPAVNITAATLAGCMVYDYTKAKSVLDWLRSNTFFQDINRLFNNPIDAVYSFLLYPFDVVAHDTAHVTESATTSILNVSTDIATYLIDGGYNFTLDGGEYYYTPYYGNFADYAFVDYSIYIPFFGIAPLNPDDVVGHTLAVKYAFDISSGACSIFLTSDGQLLRILTGSLAQAIPIISSNNNERILNLTLSALGAVGGVGKGIAESVATQNPLPALTSVGDAITDVGKTVISNPYRQAISGRLGVDTSFYAPYNCYLIINNHYYSPAAAQKAQMGAPSNYSVSLNDLTGYFSVKSIDVSSTTATVAELNEIEGLLKTGVYRS